MFLLGWFLVIPKIYFHQQTIFGWDIPDFIMPVLWLDKPGFGWG